MRGAMVVLSERGLALRRDDPGRLAMAMFQVLDLADLTEAVDG